MVSRENQGPALYALPEDPDLLNGNITRAAFELFRRRYEHSPLLRGVSAATASAAAAEGAKAAAPCRFEVFAADKASARSNTHGTHTFQKVYLASPFLPSVPAVQAASADGTTLRNDSIYVVLDIAHNEAALATLTAKIRRTFGEDASIR